jgi:tRNA G37 N-methylase Trm5
MELNNQPIEMLEHNAATNNVSLQTTYMLINARKVTLRRKVA